MKNYSFIEKWGKVTSQLGFVSVPTALLFAQSDLRINALEMNVLMNLLCTGGIKINILIPLKKL
jgi:hypothetical protein